MNRAVAQMDQVVQHSAGRTAELASTAQTLADQAAELEALVGRFRLGGTGSEPDARRRREPRRAGSRRVPVLVAAGNGPAGPFEEF